MFSSSIGIDLGTANTLVYVRGGGIVINEPSVVAINQKTWPSGGHRQRSQRMLYRLPAISAPSGPLLTASYPILKWRKKCCPTLSAGSSKTNILFLSRADHCHRRAFRHNQRGGESRPGCAKNSGAGEVFIVEEPMAAAIGVRLPVHEPVGNMIVDIGGGTTDIAVISLSGIVSAKNMRIAGDKLNQDIIQYAKDEFKLLLGEKTAEDVKMSIGSVVKKEKDWKRR